MAYDASNEKRTQLKSFRKNGHGDYIVIHSIEVEGRNPSVDIRTMYTDDNEELRPTTKGLRFSPALLPELVALFIQDMDEDEIENLAAKVNLMPSGYDLSQLESIEVDDNDEMPAFAPAVKQRNESVHIKAFKKNDRGDYIVVSRIDPETKKTAIDIRVMYTDDNDELRPTTRGVRFNVACIPELVEGLVIGMDDDALVSLASRCPNVVDFYKSIGEG